MGKRCNVSHWELRRQRKPRPHAGVFTLARDAISDPRDTFNWEIIKKGSRLGFRTLAVPREWGGKGTDFVTQALAMAELAKADSPISKTFSQCWKWSHLIAAVCDCFRDIFVSVRNVCRWPVRDLRLTVANRPTPAIESRENRTFELPIIRWAATAFRSGADGDNVSALEWQFETEGARGPRPTSETSSRVESAATLSASKAD